MRTVTQQLYDWDGWFGMGAFTIVRGKHYLCGNGSMCQQIRNAASVRGIRVETREGEEGDRIYVRVKASHEGRLPPRPIRKSKVKP